jgi:uncharacterized protein YoaH (UPF0181 family)/uncharacterized membrane protein YgcG
MFNNSNWKKHPKVGLAIENKIKAYMKKGISKKNAIAKVRAEVRQMRSNKKAQMSGFGDCDYDDEGMGFGIKIKIKAPKFKAPKAVGNVVKAITKPVNKLVKPVNKLVKPVTNVVNPIKNINALNNARKQMLKRTVGLVKRPSVGGVFAIARPVSRMFAKTVAPITSTVLKPVSSVTNPVLQTAVGVTSMVPVVGGTVSSLANEGLTNTGVITTPKAPTAVFESATPVLTSSNTEDASVSATKVYTSTPTSNIGPSSESAKVVSSSDSSGGGGGGGSSWGGSSSSRSSSSQDENEDEEETTSQKVSAPVEAPKKSAAPIVAGLAGLAGLYFLMKE